METDSKLNHSGPERDSSRDENKLEPSDGSRSAAGANDSDVRGLSSGDDDSSYTSNDEGDDESNDEGDAHESSVSSQQTRRPSYQRSKVDPGLPLGRKQKKCPRCDEVMLSSNLARHMKNKHGITPKPPKSRGPTYICKLCDKELAFYKRRIHYRDCHPGEWDGVTVSPTKLSRGGNCEKDNTKPKRELEGSAAQQSGRPPKKQKMDSTDNRRAFVAGGFSIKVMDSYWQQYVNQKFDARDRAEQMLRANLEKPFSEPGCMSHAALSLPLFLTNFTKSRPERPLLLNEFAGRSSSNRCYLLLTSAEAQHVLESGPLTVPIVVPAQFSSDVCPRLSISSYENQIKAQRSVYVRDLARDRQRGFAQWYDPEEWQEWESKVSTKEALERLHDEDGMIMFANLPVARRHSFPSFVAAVPGYHLLGPTHLPTNYNSHAADMTEVVPNTSFQVLGSKGAYSSSAYCSNGTISSFQVEEGSTIWMVWPWVHGNDLEDMVRNGTGSSDAVLIYLKPGDVLMLPSGTTHCTLMLEPTLMTGNFYWQPQDLVRTIQMILLERRFGMMEHKGKKGALWRELKRISTLWATNSSEWAWPDDGGRSLDEWLDILKNLSELPAGQAYMKESEEGEEGEEGEGSELAP